MYYTVYHDAREYPVNNRSAALHPVPGWAPSPVVSDERWAPSPVVSDEHRAHVVSWVLFLGAVLCAALAVISVIASAYTVSTAYSNQRTVNFSQLVNKLQSDILSVLDTVTKLQQNASSIIRSTELGPVTQLLVVGRDSSLPAPSCQHIHQYMPPSPSGYYWMTAGNGSTVRVYCDMSRSCGRITGGWARVANLNFRTANSSCPGNFSVRDLRGIRTCGVQGSSAGCIPVFFDTLGIAYRHVCGKVIGYQKGPARAFNAKGIDSAYLDGVSLTHGTNPRKHIWTFAAAISEGESTARDACTCSNVMIAGTAAVQAPSFVGQDYFCDSGHREEYSRDRYSSFIYNDPLWDGQGCGLNSTCCVFRNPPWFFKRLPQPTTSNIEMRVCGRSFFEKIVLSEVVLYVQ